MATKINVKVFKVETSKSKKSDVITLRQDDVIENAFGSQHRSNFFNLFVEVGTAKVKKDQELEIDLDEFTIEESALENGSTSYWLYPAN